MEKQCVWCNKPYVDVTKRKVGKTCSKECASLWMVQKRKNNGSYTRTQQQNERLSKTLLNKSKTEGFWVSPESRKLGQEKTKKTKLLTDPETGEFLYLKKKKLTCLEKYGVEFPQTIEAIKQKIIQTNIEKYGSQFPTRSKQVQEKTKKTRLEKGLTKLYEGMTMKEWSEKLGVSYSYFKQVVNEQGFESAKFLSKEQTIIEKTISELLNKYNINWIYDKFLDLDTKKQYRPDFVVEEHKLIIETDGLYWHSDAIKSDKMYHINKLKFFNDLGYRVMFFRSDEILNKTNIVESMILNAIKKTNIRYQARKTNIVELTTEESNSWFALNHLMGSGRGRTYGLQDTKTSAIVSAIRTSFNQEHKTLTIERYANLLNSTCAGGFSKLLQHVTTQLQPTKIITFLDKRYSGTNPQYLLDLGFIRSSCYPSFCWTEGSLQIHRMKYPNNTGYDHKLNKLWDCGQEKWIKTIKND